MHDVGTRRFATLCPPYMLIPIDEEASMNARPPMLTGYRVLDFTQIVAGPTCTRMLAELGAEVIKVELAPGGDRGRVAGHKPQAHRDCSLSTYYFQHNHSKKSLALDFKHPRGRDLLKAMVPKVDVLVENFSPGVMARAGFAYEELRKINPALVMCSISVAGQKGPLSDKPGYDYIGQSYAGVTGLIGEPDGSPAMFTMAVGDTATGIAAAMGIGFALLHRERTGEGQYIDASILDAYFNMHEVNIPRISVRGSTYVPKRTGSQRPDGGPAGIFRYRDDQFVTLMVLPHQWPQLVKALNMPELATDPRFCSPRARRDNNEAIKVIIEKWLDAFPSREAAIQALEAERVPCAPVLTLHECVAHPHLRERKTVRRVKDPLMGEFDIPGMPIKFSQWSDHADLKADLLGQHNDEILGELLGLSASEIAALYADNVLVRDPMLDES
jgi:crotonobetainyl-CoA:carnitine CoA-transferase CaiB-like acyl-CoA transferase